MNLEEVAKRAGVSTATVSRVLNDLHVVRSSTRTRVLRAVKELNYHPNLHARTLAGGKSNTIGLIVSNLENPFFFDIYKSLEESARHRGYEVVAANTGYQPDRLVRAVRLMIGRRVSGLAAIVSEMDGDLIRDLEDAHIPAVFYDVGTPHAKISNIRVNYRRGIEQVVEHLHGLGHRRMAFIGHHSMLGPTSEREVAFVESVSRYAPDTTWMTTADQDGLDGGNAAACRILDSGFSPTAIICVNDYMAVGALRAIKDRGLRVPDDISITGFDNTRLSEYCSPRLTTMHIPRAEIGALAFDMLARESGQLSQGREVVIDAELVVRQSTGLAG